MLRLWLYPICRLDPIYLNLPLLISKLCMLQPVASVQIYFLGGGGRRNNFIWRQTDIDALTFHAAHVPMYLD